MKKIFVITVLFFILSIGQTIAQSVKVKFVRFKKIEYSNYRQSWNSWPVAWNESGAYAIIRRVYGQTYNVSIYGYDDVFIVSSTCTFDPSVTAKKRISESLTYLNCYTDTDNDQVWTNVVSLESLLNNVNDWKQEDAQLYLWVFSVSTPYAFIFE